MTNCYSFCESSVTRALEAQLGGFPLLSYPYHLWTHIPLLFTTVLNVNSQPVITIQLVGIIKLMAS